MRQFVAQRPFLQRLLTWGTMLLVVVALLLLANSFATALGLAFKRIQFTPDLLPGDITGGYVFNRASGEFELRT
ncbi:MAG: AAA family ATPase, partial [Candidatus Promineifilaceae bacterium]